MSWKQRLNKEEYTINKEVDEYLKGHDFYESKLSPRFFNQESYANDIIEHDAQCLRLDTDDPRDEYGDNTMRIFITSKEVYMEVQNGYRSYDRSFHIIIDEDRYLDTEYIDEILDIVTSR